MSLVNRTTGMSLAFAKVLISSTYPRPILPRIAGDGIVPPAWSFKNLTSCPSHCNRGTYPARKIRSTDLTCNETWSASRLEMVATAAPPAPERSQAPTGLHAGPTARI
jgi:hypothetical protein